MTSGICSGCGGRHQARWRGGGLWEADPCPKRAGRPSTAPGGPALRGGARDEERLYDALGGVWWEVAPGTLPLKSDGVPKMWLRQYPWGAFLFPPRRFHADAAFPRARILVEIEGHAHAVKRQRSHDVRRRQLAEAAGWRVLSVLPEQARNGEAIMLIRAALGER